MTQGKNKLLSRLLLIGVASVAAMGPQTIVARTAQDIPALTAAEMDAQAKILSLVAFLRAYPNSPMARKIAAEMVTLFQGLSPAARAQVAAEIASSGGLPDQVAELVGLPAVATAALPRAALPPSIY